MSILLAVWCQLRPQEIHGLRRRHIDVAAGRISIKETMTNSNGEMIAGPTKTLAGTRTVYVPEHVLPYLMTHLDKFAGEGNDGWLFPGPNGSCVSTRTIQRHWVQAREAIKRPDLRFYDMRHSGLTLVGGSGASLKAVMKSGGHSDVAVAMRYQPASDSESKLTAERLTAIAQAASEEDSDEKGHAGGTDTDKADVIAAETNSNIGDGATTIAPSSVQGCTIKPPAQDQTLITVVRP